jgi:glycosyltransferase involved in cell wall biosynthesis
LASARSTVRNAATAAALTVIGATPSTPDLRYGTDAASVPEDLTVLSILVAAATRAGGVAAFAGGSAVELVSLGVHVRTFSTDLAVAPWKWIQPQRRVRRDELHPALAASDLQLFPVRFPRRMAFSPALARALRRELSAVDVLHIHNLWQHPQYAAYRAALRHNVPYVVSPHGAFDPYLRQRSRIPKRVSTAVWQREMLDNAALIHVTTDAERDAIADISPHVPRVVVPCSLYVEDFASLPTRTHFRRSRLGGYDGPLILFLGRITQKKGLDVLLRAFALVRRDHEAKLAVVGPDDEGLLPTLRSLAAELRIEADVVFMDPLYGEDRLAALASADVWALSSHAENFGIAVAEAMAAGCVVVTSPGVDISAEIAAEGAGLVAAASPEPFAQALLKVLSEDRLRTQLREAARRFARRYDWSAVAPQLREMYRSVAA